MQYQGSQSAAGNYIVIDGKGTGHDYVYMHLKKPSPLKEGDKVKTGEKIGVVGETGDATGCHLHFEEWCAPGWYEGGTLHEGGHEAPQEVGLLELIGALAPRLRQLARDFTASSVSRRSPLTLGALWALPARGAAGESPHPIDLRCIEGCAGRQTAAVGSSMRGHGERLKHVTEVTSAARRAGSRRGRRSRGSIASPSTSHRAPGADGPGSSRADGGAARIPKLLRIVEPGEASRSRQLSAARCGRHARARLR